MYTSADVCLTLRLSQAIASNMTSKEEHELYGRLHRLREPGAKATVLMKNRSKQD